MGNFPEIGHANIFRKRLVILKLLNELLNRFSDCRFFIQADRLGTLFGALLLNKQGTHLIIIKIYEI